MLDPTALYNYTLEFWIVYPILGTNLLEAFMACSLSSDTVMHPLASSKSIPVYAVSYSTHIHSIRLFPFPYYGVMFPLSLSTSSLLGFGDS